MSFSTTISSKNDTNKQYQRQQARAGHLSCSSFVSLILALKLSSLSAVVLLVVSGASSGNRANLRLSSGILAQEHQWPFYAWLQNAEQSCGAIVLERFILTAASCVRDVQPETLQVSVGTNERKANIHTYAVRKVCTSSLFRLSEDGRRFEDDFAMLYMDRPIELDGKTIDKVNITREDDPDTDWYARDGIQCFVIGAGLTAERATLSDKLMQSPIKIRACPKRQTKGSKSVICYRILGPTAAVSCEGDSGGPLVCKRAGSFELVGVISHHSTKICQPYEARLGLMEAAKFQRFVNTTFYDCVEWFESMEEQQAGGGRKRLKK